MKLLAIETATENCSAAILVDEEIFEINKVAPRKHNQLILSMCEKVLAESEIQLSQLDAIAFGRGPGAFTGVRLAASVTQGIAFAQDLPVVPVSTLAALAQEVKGYNTVFACIDARMQEVYVGAFQIVNGFMQPLTDEQVLKPEHVEFEKFDNYFGVGSGWKTYADVLLEKSNEKIKYDPHALPQAKYIAVLGNQYYSEGNSVSAIDALPVYLRNNVAKKPKSKSFV